MYQLLHLQLNCWTGKSWKKTAGQNFLPLYGISGELTKYYGLQAIYEGINLLNSQYYRRDEALKMLSKCHEMISQQHEQLAGAVKVFMEIVYKTKLNSIQLNTLEIWDHVIVGGNEYTSFADTRDCCEKN